MRSKEMLYINEPTGEWAEAVLVREQLRIYCREFQLPDGRSRTIYYRDLPEIDAGYIKRHEYCDKDGKLHREDGPAFIECNRHGIIILQRYHQNGELHREDGPAIISCDENGQPIWQDYFLHGKIFQSKTSAKNRKIKMFRKTRRG